MLNAIFDTLLPVFGITKPTLASLDQMYVIPVKVKQVNKAPKQQKRSSMFVENEETRTYGFYKDTKTDREGSVERVTDYDFTVLKQRNFPHKGKYWAAVCEAKRQWHGDMSVAQAAKNMHLSPSWIEKRFACFSSALEMEKADAQK